MGPRKTYRVVGYQQLTALNTIASLTIPTRAPDGTTANPNAVLLQANTQDVRYLDNGDGPSASVGMILRATADPWYYDGNLRALRFIEASASAQLNVTYLEDEAQ